MSDTSLVEADRILPWWRSHNRVVNAFLTELKGVRVTKSALNGQERAVLSLAFGIERFAQSWSPGQIDSLAAEALRQLMLGFHALLDQDIGTRLDMGTLESWSCEVQDWWGIDPDTGEWTPKEDEH